MKDTLLDENEEQHPWRSDAQQDHWNNEEQDLRNDVVTWVDWQWSNNPGSILNAMKFWTEDKTVALELLIQGQQEKWQDQYRKAAQKLSDFWWLVFYTPWSESDFDDLEISLRWQARHNWDSLWKSQDAWDSNPSQDTWAYYYLLSGQVNNPDDLKNFRACWNKDKNRVMSLVKELI